MTAFPQRLTRAAAMSLTGLALASCAHGTAPIGDSSVGRWGSSDDDETHLTILEDGSILGFDGCNGLGGDWESANDTVVFSETYMTLMACPGVDAWLAGLSTAVVVNDVLHVRDAEGDQIGVLPRVNDAS